MSRSEPNNEDAKSLDPSRLTTQLWGIVGLAAVVVVVVLIFYFRQFDGPLADRPEIWGQFGDYLGGVLNPFLSFLALIALLLTIALQSHSLQVSRRELANSTRELKHSAEALRAQNESIRNQTFEGAFFQLLRFHNEIVNGIDIRGSSADANATTLGRDCFKVFFDRLRRTFQKTSAGLDPAYAHFFEKHQADLGHYFRNLYHIIKYVDASDAEDPRRYTSLVRAQLSSYELLLLFYNCVSPWGSEKFKPLVEEYALLENLSQSQLLSSDHVKLYDSRAFGSNAP